MTTVATPLPDVFRGTARFQPRALLGRGSMGVVYRVHDVDLECDVALKTLLHLQPDDLYRLKAEFRSLSGISHANLVTFYELVHQGDLCFYTMELVDGVDFLRFVREPSAEESATGAPGLQRLRSSLMQVADGLAALHAADKVHRDIRPSNVLVERAGRVVILDFGLAATWMTTRAPSGAEFAGTVAYMAPEQLQATRPNPAADWYAVGAMLYEAITGRVPFEGPAAQMLWRRGQSVPTWPREAERAPVWLRDLVTRLLDPDPERRAAHADILAAAEPARGRTTTAWFGGAAAESFVGRTGELAVLRASLDRVRAGHATLVEVMGPSGIGKTELVGRFLGATDPEDAFVLRGRCLPQELVPYKAFDAAVDALSLLLEQLPAGKRAQVLAPGIAALARLFPVLDPLAAAYGAHDAELTPDPRAQRQRGFGALRDLLARLATLRPVVLWIDDAQWSDPDSIAMLSDLLRTQEPAALLVVLSYRSEAGERLPWLHGLESDGDATALGARVVRLAPLPHGEAHALATALCPPRLRSRQRVTTLVAESGGSPFFIGELARALDAATDAQGLVVRLADAVTRRAEQLSSPARELLELICVAGHALTRRVALAALGQGAQGRPLAVLLENLRFLREVVLDDEPALQAYHDRIREAVVACLPVERLQRCHRRIAEALQRSERANPEYLFEHFLGAGDERQAATYAATAAERAARTLAFDRAAVLYAEAVRLQRDTRLHGRLLAGRADALANQGRGREAAEVFELATSLAAAAPADPGVVTLRRRAAEHYLRSGLIDTGLAVTRDVLAASDISLPATVNRAFLAALYQRGRLAYRGMTVPVEPPAASPERLQRLDACWSAAISLSVVNPALGEPLAVQHLIEALDLGEHSRLIHAVGYEAARAASVGGRLFRRRSRRLLELLDHLGTNATAPYDRAWVEFAHGVASYCCGGWDEGQRRCDIAAATWRERCTGVSWEIVTADVFAVTALAHMGRLGTLAERLPGMIADADARGDVYASIGLRTGMPNLHWLALDQPTRARRQADAAIAAMPTELFNVQHYLHFLANVHVDLYLGNPERAWARVLATWPRLRRARLLHLELFHLEAHWLRARVAVALASALTHAERMIGPRGWTVRRLLRRAEIDARKIASDRLLPTTAFVTAIRAGVAGCRGERVAAARRFARAADRFARTGMTLHAAAATLAGAGADGGAAAATSAAEATFRREAVRAPATFARVLVPPGYAPARALYPLPSGGVRPIAAG